MIKDENMTNGKVSAVFARACLAQYAHWRKSSGLGLW